MKKIVVWVALGAALIVLVSGGMTSARKHLRNKSAQGLDLQEGDILFQSLDSRQCEAIKLATGSKWSHCGIVLMHEGKLRVLEAIQPVKWTSIDEWTSREDGQFAAMCLKDAGDLTADEILCMRQMGEGLVGKNYDIYFNWSDDEWYCSELVWKLYERCAGVRPGEPKAMGDYNLSHPRVQAVMDERYGKNPPLEQPMISPGDIADSPVLVQRSLK